MEELTWTFDRGGQRLELRRRDVPEGMLLVVTGDGAPRSYFFQSIEKLVTFQTDMESFLISTGWTFVAFSPDRRTGRERRHFPRLTERRRWWTDSRRETAEAAVSRRRRSGEG